jgi:hypothetical protein
MTTILAIPLAVLIGVYWSWAASVLWAWFAVPHGLPALSMWQMCGLLVLLAAVRGARPVFKVDVIDWDASAFNMAFGPLILLALGWLFRELGA